MREKYIRYHGNNINIMQTHPSPKTLLENFRLTTFDILGGLAIIVEYDKIIDDGNTIYGVEETRDPKLAPLKALQALSGSLLLPWLPYRIDSQLLKSAPTPGLATRFPSRTGANGSDARILDMIGGELSMTAKIAAIMPAPETKHYSKILSTAAKNTANILAKDNKLLADTLKAIENFLHGTLRENLYTLSKLIANSQLTPDQAHQQQLHIEGKTTSNLDIEKVVIISPIIHGEYELKVLVNALTKYLEKMPQQGKNIDFYIAAPDDQLANQIVDVLNKKKNYRVSNTYTFGRDFSDEDRVKKIAENIANMGGTKKKLYTILLDIPDILAEKLGEAIKNQQDIHIAWVLHRIRYKYDKYLKDYIFDTSPTLTLIR